MREGCRRILASQGHEVASAESGEQALAMVTPDAFDLALVDLKMRGISGLELVPRLRAADPHLMCIMVTAYATLETAVAATKNGAYDYLAKPFIPEELTAVVNKALERHRLSLEAATLREERERSLLLLATEQSRTRTIVQSMADGLLVTNREGKLVLYNPAALRLLRVKSGLPALGEPPSQALFPAELLELMAAALSDGGATMVARELPGGPPIVSASVALIRDEAGERLGVVAVLRDITELKSLQQAMGDFVSMVAHELRSPLGAIAQCLDVLCSGVVADRPGKQQDLLGRCRQRVGALSQLVRDLLEYSVRGQNRVARSLAPLRLDALLREAVEQVRPQAEAANVEMQLDLADDLPQVEADRDEMVRLFTNLLNNAVKYNRAGGWVRVSGQATEGYVAVEVADSGLGIPAGALTRLGEPFLRVKTAATGHITGTGLGLSICKQIVDAHNGHLEVESEEGKGSTFRVLLPRWEREPTTLTSSQASTDA